MRPKLSPRATPNRYVRGGWISATLRKKLSLFI
jgi:hypothetical protein